MKRRWLLLLVAAIILLMFPMVSQAGGRAANEVQLEGETAPVVTPTPEPEQTPAPTATPTITLDKHSITVYVGDTIRMKETTSPEGLPTVWGHTCPPLSMYERGVFVADCGPGTGTISVYIGDTNIHDTCNVTVLPIPVDNIKMDKSSCTIAIGESIYLIATVSPDNATYKWANWSTSDYWIASANSEGLTGASANRCRVTGNHVGTVTITAATDGRSDTCQVTVFDPSATPTPALATATTQSPRPSSDGSSTPGPTRGTEGGDAPKPTRVPVQLDATGWEAAEEALTGMETGSLGSIQTPDDTLVPVSLLQTLQQTQCALAIDMGGYTCTIDGVDLAEIPDDFGSVDIGMTMEKDAALSATCGGNAYELRFNYHGELPGLFTFRVKAEGSRPGDTIYVYYFDEEAGVFEGLLVATVDDEGYVSFGITHCSSYYIASEMIPGAKNNFEVPSEVMAEPEAERSGFAAFIEDNYIAFWVSVYTLGSGVIVAAFVLIFRRKRKQRVDPVQHTYMKQ